jgi:hypothetical protein
VRPKSCNSASRRGLKHATRARAHGSRRRRAAPTNGFGGLSCLQPLPLHGCEGAWPGLPKHLESAVVAGRWHSAVGSDLSANVEGSTASREATAPAGSTTDRDQTRHLTAADFPRESRACALGAGGCSRGLYLQHDVGGGQRHKQDCRVSAAWPTKQQCAEACAAGGHACVKHVVEARAQRHVGPSEVEHLQSALEASPPLPAFGP